MTHADKPDYVNPVVDHAAEQIVKQAVKIGQLESAVIRWVGEHDAERERRIFAERALANLLDDTQHERHPDCADGPCPVREARDHLRYYGVTDVQ